MRALNVYGGKVLYPATLAVAYVKSKAETGNLMARTKKVADSSESAPAVKPSKGNHKPL